MLGGTEERSSTVLVAKDGSGGASDKARFNGQRASEPGYVDGSCVGYCTPYLFVCGRDDLL